MCATFCEWFVSNDVMINTLEPEIYNQGDHVCRIVASYNCCSCHFAVKGLKGDTMMLFFV